MEKYSIVVQCEKECYKNVLDMLEKFSRMHIIKEKIEIIIFIRYYCDAVSMYSCNVNGVELKFKSGNHYTNEAQIDRIRAITSPDGTHGILKCSYTNTIICMSPTVSYLKCILNELGRIAIKKKISIPKDIMLCIFAFL